MNTVQGTGIVNASGDQFTLARTHKSHFGAGPDAPAKAEQQDFGSMLVQSLQEVNSLQHEASDVAVAAVIHPDEVDAHDVTIAAAKAELALNLTKNIVDRVIQGYKDISNLR
ncbi:MAG: flagellar hook-basal body complex protein FliE [Spirochaetaceae bacterium]|nr:MAG: flagellar hook-basal body complex protein FliE [Spirochaetaceae bacterium]